ncbi:3-methyl-2-oxobutanoate hydroxymethyltransferase [bacterium]|nr:3-methyl-2-oxobutanoate hydroxymethyltransferase [bacterium]RQV93263.1 MAG: 3-methyl-2-oxobutanoate hydroxymethyltransferase [bacterium]
MGSQEKITIPKIMKMKEKGEKIACLTAYDWIMATLLDVSEIDLILIGDSGAMVFAGHNTTLPITVDQMVYHTQSVTRGVTRALTITDMPFLSYQVNPEDALRNAGRFLKKGGADGVKLEGGCSILETVQKLVKSGIPVMGHIGLTPQSIRVFGGYPIQGKKTGEADRLKQDAKCLEEAGAFSLVLEKIPAGLAKEITQSIAIPTIGIGAGPYCDGQILVTHDMLGLFESFKPRFVRRYAEIAQIIRQSVAQYTKEVKEGKYPSSEESY